MNELIPIQEQSEGKQAVLGRDLHEFLEVRIVTTTGFLAWLPMASMLVRILRNFP